jgi:hypothetical protein
MIKHKTRKIKQDGNNRKQKCVKTYCKRILLDMLKKQPAMNVKTLNQNKDYTKEEREEIMKSIRFLKSKQYKKEIMDNCMLTNCNPGCKDTIFEPGDPNKLPDGVVKIYKDNKPFQEMLLQQRKKCFGCRFLF